MTKPSESAGMPGAMTGDRSYGKLRGRFMELMRDAPGVVSGTYESPELYSMNRVTYIIPPVTDIERRDEWHPGDIYVVNGGTVAIGRVFYTRTSGEYLVEELILREGDIFGEFEVPLTILGTERPSRVTFPPRFNMTYGAWASGPALNWAMCYPRDIPRDPVVRDNARVAVHPFYIKSKNIRPETRADILTLPVGEFETIARKQPEAMTWFLMNVLRKTRLYFEPPSQGYGRSPVDILSRLFIRILAHRIRLGIAVFDETAGIMSCRTFIGPAEWLKFGLGAFMADMKSVIRDLGGPSRDPLPMPVFNDELADLMTVTTHFPVKDLDDATLTAMGCNPVEDRRDNRYGLLTGIRMEVRDLAAFNAYLLEKGE